MISYRFVPISSQNGVLFFETPGSAGRTARKITKYFDLSTFN